MRNALKIFLAIFALIGIGNSKLQAQELPDYITLDFDFMEWAVYTMADWTTNENLYRITITNTSPTETARGVMVEMQVSVANSPAVEAMEVGWGVTWGDDLAPGQRIVYRNDSAFKDDALRDEEFSSEFEDAVLAVGSSLPAGDYTYSFRLLYDLEYANGMGGQHPDPNLAISMGWILASETRTVTITQPSDPELQYPGEPTPEGLSIYEANPNFQWLSTGASAGSQMFFNLVVCLKEDNQSNDEAMQNLPFFELGWDRSIQFNEPGSQVMISYQYPATEEGFSAGNKYVWQVTARDERNMEDPSSGFIGNSEIFCFQFGDSPSLINPAPDGVVSSVMPGFAWTSALGAQGYQVRLATDEDPTVENDYYEEDASTTTLDHTPENVYLIPGKTYFWKVRALPEGRWCDPEQFTVQEIELNSPSAGEEITTVLPAFSVGGLQGAGGYEFYISGSEDPELNSPYIFQSPSQNYNYSLSEDLKLQPGQTYYWKAAALTPGGELIGEFEDYVNIGQFVVQGITINSPDVGAVENTLRPIFSWSGPNGVRVWEIQIKNQNDMGTVSGIMSSSYIYQTNAELALVPGNTYQWRVYPIVEGAILGELEDYAESEFSIEPLELTQPQNGDVISTLYPNFSWSALGLCPGETYEFQISGSSDPTVSNPEWTYQTTDQSFIYPSNADLELQMNETYYWKVRISHPEQGLIGEGEDFPVSSFSTQYSGEIDLHVSIPGNTPLLPQFSWNGVSEATTYVLSICYSQDEFDIHSEVTGINGTYYNYRTSDEALDFNVQYFAKVKALNGNTVIVQSDFEPFTCEFTEMVLNVTVNETDPLHPVFDWSAAAGASSYHVFVNNTPDLNQYIWEGVTSLTNLTYPADAPALTFGVTMYARVQAYGATGEPYSEPSEVVPFSIEAVEYNLQVLQTANAPLNPSFNWNTIPSAQYYELTIAESGDMQNVVFSGQVSGTSYNYSASDPSLMMENTYFVQVQGFSAGGEELGEPSNIEMFLTPGIEYNLSVIFQENQPLNQLFNWSMAPGAAGYTFRLFEGTDLTNPIYETTITSVNFSYPPDAPMINFMTYYFVTVQAVNSQGDAIGPESDPVGFMTPPMPVLELSAPQNDELTYTKTPGFSWQGISLLNHYIVKVSNTDNMDNAFWEAEVQGSSITYNGAEQLQYGITYYWQVSGYLQNDQLAAMSGIYHFNIASMTPELIRPDNGATAMSINPVFMWSNPEAGNMSPAYYKVWIGIRPTLPAPFFEQEVTLTTMNYPPDALPLSYSSLYYWKVRAFDGDDIPMGQASAIRSFNTPLGGPNLVSPVNTSVPTMVPTFMWDEMTGATEYEVKVYADGELSNLIWSGNSGMGSLLYAGSALQNTTNYYWTVQALADGQPYGLLSNSAFFVTPSVGAPSLVSPTEGAASNDNRPMFIWSGIEGAASYGVDISNAQDMTSIIAGLTSSESSLLYPGEPALGWDADYYWRVTAVDGSGVQMGEQSSIGHFRTPTYTSPNPIAPTGEVTTTRPVFQWEELGGCAGYRIQVSAGAEFAELLWDDITSGTSTPYGADNPLEYSSSYYWRVRGLDSSEEFVGQWSNGTAFSIGAAMPLALIAPVGGEIFTLTPTFEWNALTGAAKYGIWVYADQEMTNQLWNNNQLTSTTVMYPSTGVSPLAYGSSYWWKAGAFDQNGNQLGTTSEASSFAISGAMTPVPAYPVNTQIEEIIPIFSWEAVLNVGNYQLQLSANADFTQIFWTGSAASNTTVYTGAGTLLYNTNYWWRVRSTNAQGEALGDFSAPSQFTTPAGEIQVELLFEP